MPVGAGRCGGAVDLSGDLAGQTALPRLTRLRLVGSDRRGDAVIPSTIRAHAKAGKTGAFHGNSGECGTRENVGLKALKTVANLQPVLAIVPLAGLFKRALCAF